MQWRRRHCCPIKMPWSSKRSLFRTHALGVVSLVSLAGVFLFVCRQDWLPGRRDNPVAYTVRGFRPPRGETNQSLPRGQWREALPVPPKPGANLSSDQAEVPVQEVTGLENSLSANSSLYREKGAGGQPLARPYRYIINQRDACRDAKPFLVLLIAAEPGQAEARKAIRQTWGNHSLIPGLGMVRIFLLGLGRPGDVRLQRSIEEEGRRHRDIVQQEYMDTYYNLTIKTLMGMNWVAVHCPQAAYVMKTDSDMFVNTEYLVQKLLKPGIPPRRNYFTGYLMRGYAPNRNKDSKWYMSPELYPSERYPVFCSGTGYVFSADLAEKIYGVSLGIRRLHLEDVYVGDLPGQAAH